MVQAGWEKERGPRAPPCRPKGGSERKRSGTAGERALGIESCIFHVRMRILMNLGGGLGGRGGGICAESEDSGEGLGCVCGEEGKRAWRRARTLVCAGRAFSTRTREHSEQRTDLDGAEECL